MNSNLLVTYTNKQSPAILSYIKHLNSLRVYVRMSPLLSLEYLSYIVNNVMDNDISEGILEEILNYPNNHSIEEDITVIYE